MIPPGLEPGTFCVLDRCHDQLDHGIEWIMSSSYSMETELAIMNTKRFSAFLWRLL